MKGGCETLWTLFPPPPPPSIYNWCGRMFRLIVTVLLLGLALSSCLKTDVRDCSDTKDEFDEILRCRLYQANDHVQNVLKHIESKNYGDRLRKLNRDLEDWAEKQEKDLEKIIKSMDSNLNKIKNKGPVAALLGDLTRIIGVVAGIPFRAANIVFRDVLGLNTFWSSILTSVGASYCFYSWFGSVQTK